MIIPKFYGTVKDSKLYFDNRNNFDLYVGTLDGNKVEVIVKKIKKNRSTRSNNYYWVYLTLLEAETGNAKDDLHEYFKSRYLSRRIGTLNGKEIMLPPTTTNLSTGEMSEYIRNIEMESGINATDPNEYYN